MAQRNYIVRAGFVVALLRTSQDGSTSTKTYESGEKLALEDDQYALHAHKLELADQADRDAALAVEQQAQVAKHATASPAALVSTLVEALQHALGAPSETAVA